MIDYIKNFRARALVVSLFLMGFLISTSNLMEAADYPVKAETKIEGAVFQNKTPSLSDRLDQNKFWISLGLIGTSILFLPAALEESLKNEL